MDMYEARQNKEKVSRRIESAGDRVTRRVKVDSGGRLINVIQRKLYDSKKYYRLFIFIEFMMVMIGFA